MFLDNFLIAAEQVAILYILVAVGFIADRTKLFTEKAARLCTDLMFYIITPAKIVQSFISMEFSRESATRLAIAAACGAAIHMIGVEISIQQIRISVQTISVVLILFSSDNRKQIVFLHHAQHSFRIPMNPFSLKPDLHPPVPRCLFDLLLTGFNLLSQRKITIR